jgi:polyisoprenyl-phosphate glycosyltransferase
MPLLTILTPCFNEEVNVREVCAEVKRVMAQLPDHEYEHLFIDNASTDQTVEILREIARDDPHVKVIVNARNFGTIRSGYYGLLQAAGDAIVLLVADLQDPPDMILDFVRQWHEGYKIAIGVKAGSKESPLMYRVRKSYYWLIGRLSEVELVSGFTGFGLYDREVIEQCRMTEEQYPYFRGLICDFGYERAETSYIQPARARGKTKQGLYTLYDAAMFGITSHSKIPLRIAALTGFIVSFLSLLVALVYLVLKLLFWPYIQIGIAPLVIGMFFFGAVQLFFIGIVGEYIGSIHTQVHRRPLVVEKTRINLDRPKFNSFGAEPALQPADRSQSLDG